MFRSAALRTHLAMVVGCLACAGLTAYWLFTLSGPVEPVADWARGRAYFQRQPHAWAVVAGLGPGMLGIAITLVLLIAWSVLLVVPIRLRWLGEPEEGHRAMAGWWRFRSPYGVALVLIECGVVLVLFGFFTWASGQNSTLQKDWGRFQWLAIERNPEYLFRDYNYRELCGLFARPALWAGAALAGIGMLLVLRRRTA